MEKKSKSLFLWYLVGTGLWFLLIGFIPAKSSEWSTFLRDYLDMTLGFSVCCFVFSVPDKRKQYVMLLPLIPVLLRFIY